MHNSHTSLSFSFIYECPVSHLIRRDSLTILCVASPMPCVFFITGFFLDCLKCAHDLRLASNIRVQGPASTHLSIYWRIKTFDVTSSVAMTTINVSCYKQSSFSVADGLLRYDISQIDSRPNSIQESRVHHPTLYERRLCYLVFTSNLNFA